MTYSAQYEAMVLDFKFLALLGEKRSQPMSDSHSEGKITGS